MTLVAASALESLPAFAQEGVVCDPNYPEECAVGLAVGRPAPFTGQLLTIPLATRLGLEAEGCPDKVTIEVKRALGHAHAESTLALRLKDIDLGLARSEAAMWRTQAEALEPAFYEKPWFVATASVLGTVLVIGLGIAAVNAANNITN